MLAIHAEETGGEAPGRLVVVLVLLGGIGQGGRRADAGDLVRRLPGQGSDPADQAGDLGSGGPGVGVGLVKDEVLERGLGEERHVGRAGGQDFQLPEVGQQDAGLALADVFLGAALFGRGQGAHGPVLGLGLLPALAGGRPGMPAAPDPGKRSIADIAFVRRRGADPLAEGDAGAAEHVPQAVNWSLARAFIG